MLTLFHRHRRIHEAHQDGQQLSGTNEEDFENEDNEENEFGFADENSSPAHPAPGAMVNPNSVASTPPVNMSSAMPTMMPPQMVAPQLLQQHI